MRLFATAATALALASLSLVGQAVAKPKAAPAAASAAAPAATPAPAAKATKGTSKMSGCAAQWKAMSDGDKGKYNQKATGMKSKKGGKLSGYNVWTGECMKKA